MYRPARSRGGLEFLPALPLAVQELRRLQQHAGNLPEALSLAAQGNGEGVYVEMQQEFGGSQAGQSRSTSGVPVPPQRRELCDHPVQFLGRQAAAA